MIPYHTYPIINLGFIHLKTWGVLTALGFLVAMILALSKAKTRNEKDHIYNITAIIITSSIIGSKLLNVIESWPEYASNPAEILNIFSGGLSFYGGFILAVACAYVYIRMARLNFWVIADKIAAPAALGMVVGRLGCWFIGDHLGKEANLPWSIMHNGVLRHPVTLYQLISMILLFMILIILEKKEITKKTFPGFLFTIFTMGYALHRLIFDYFRTDPKYFLNLTSAQIISLFILVVSFAFMFIKFKRNKISESVKGDKKTKDKPSNNKEHNDKGYKEIIDNEERDIDEE